jgi:hypothetical protein
MELTPSWEAASYTAAQEFSNILWKPKVHYRVHKGPPLVPIQIQINSVQTTPYYLRSISELCSYLRLGFPSGLFPSVFPTDILYGLHICHMFCPFRLPWLDYSNYTWRRVQVMKESIFLILGPLSEESVPCPRLFVTFRNTFFYGELLAPPSTPKLEDHPLLAVCECLFSIFEATLHIMRPSPPSATWGLAMPW